MAQVASKAPSARRSTHESVLSWVTAKIGDRGRVVMPTREIAEALGLSQNVAYYHLRALAKAGSLLVRPRGRSGLELQVPSARDRRARGATVTRASKPPVRTSRTKRFCPWCGTPAQSSWKHCPECGKRLPWAAASTVLPPPRGTRRAG